LIKVCYCGNEFNTYQSKIALGRGKYCSKPCSDNHHKGQHFSPRTELKKGIKLSESTKQKMRGRTPWNYKGKTTNDQGYILRHAPKHPEADQHGQIREHRLIVEKHIGRTLQKSEVVHHVNEVRNDNRIQNLMVFRTNTTHLRFHRNLPIPQTDIIFDGRSVTEGVTITP
jgi:hypothetical protein